MSAIDYFPLKYFEDKRGSVMHFLKSTDEYFQDFGECYVSWINPGYVKGWYKHTKNISLLTSPTANLKIVFYDDRKNSDFYKSIHIIEIKKDNYGLVRIPTDVWYSFKTVNNQPAIIVNVLNNVYEAEEVERLSLETAEIPFSWHKHV